MSTRSYSINKKTHILGYNCDTNNKVLLDMCNTTLLRRNQSYIDSIDIINRHGDVHINMNTLKKYTSPNSIYMQQIMKYLVDIGYAKDIFGLKQKLIFNDNTGYAKVDIEYPDARDAISAIRSAGGIPVLAHTFASDDFCAIDEMLEAGLMGIEVSHPKHNQDQRKQLIEFCQANNLLITCGSDNHGIYNMIKAPIGSTTMKYNLISEFVSMLK